MPRPTHDSLEVKGLLRPELFIGVLSTVTAQTVRFNVSSAGSPSGMQYQGGRYGKGEVGEFVVIEGQIAHVLGRIVDVRLPEHDRRSVNPSAAHPDNLDAIGTIQLLGSIAVDSMCVTAGIQSYPRLGDRIYAAPHEMLAKLPQLMELEDSDHPSVLLSLGSIDVARESEIAVKPEKLFGRHCAILGATGGGKSWTTARVIEECIKHESKIILLDATGEYRDFDNPNVTHVHLGQPLEIAKGSLHSSMPPNSFIESDFLAMFEPSGKVQGPRLRAAIKSLRLAEIVPTLATNGLIKKSGKSKKPFESEEVKPDIAAKLDDPSTPFDVHKLSQQLEEECVFPSGNYGKDPTKWGDISSADYSYCLSLMTRIHAVLSSPAYSCVFKDTQHPLDGIIKSFTHDKKRLLRICLSGIAHEFNAREIIANVVGRKLLSLARSGKYITTPHVTFLDEAHSFIGRHIGTEDNVARLDAFELIAKEGRKYGLSICLATQRPRDITEGVLSQMGTLIVHRLTNDRDREVVERACGEIDRAAASFLPTLKPGEAAIIGADFPIPLTIQVTPPTTRPLSDGPKYQKHWKIAATQEVDAAD